MRVADTYFCAYVLLRAIQWQGLAFAKYHALVKYARSSFFVETRVSPWAIFISFSWRAGIAADQVKPHLSNRHPGFTNPDHLHNATE